MAAMVENGGTTTQVRFAGVGGQGIVMVGRLLGRAALLDGKEAVCTQSYGPEARGGASRADVIVSDNPIDYPFVTEADALAIFFQEAYVRFRNELRPGGTVIIDTGLVQPSDDDADVLGLPATTIAEELGNRLATNVVMLGFLIGKTGIVSRDSIEEAIRTTMNPSVVELDLRALDTGIQRAQSDRSQ